MSMTAKEWSLRALAVEIGMDRAVLAKRLKGLKPCRIDGRSHLYFMADVFRHLSHGENLDPAQEAAKLNKARRENLELEKSVREGELVPVGAVQELWAAEIGKAKAKLFAIPSKATTRVMAADDYAEGEAILKNLIREALQELADDTETETPLDEGEDPKPAESA